MEDPGPDGISSEVLKLLRKYKPNLLLNALKACFTAGVFPCQWKVSKVVLIGMGNGDPEVASADRPLSTLRTAGSCLRSLSSEK